MKRYFRSQEDRHTFTLYFYLLFESPENFQLLLGGKVCAILVLIIISSRFAGKERRWR